MTTATATRKWIDDLEIENAQIKWPFSHFDGKKDVFNEEGQRNFTIIIPPENAQFLIDEGWPIRESKTLEEDDPPEYLLKVHISYKYEPPKIFLIKGNRKVRVEKESELSDISRSTCDNINVIISPSRWVHGAKTGISAYAKEIYATVKESRFSEMYADYEEV